MRFITGLVFIANIALWIIGVAAGFAEEGIFGVSVIIGLIGFFIAWRISGEVVTSPADYFFQPEWDVFKIKLKWANGIGITTAVVAGTLFWVIIEGV